jgi:hypothetical protein
MKKKMRKFADGGFTAAQEEWLGGADRTDPYILARMRSAVPDSPKEEYITETGKNPRIDDDTRARAMKFVEDAGDSSPVTKSITKTKVSVTKPATKSDMESPARKAETPEENKARMEELTKKQALINVEPENYVPGIGMVKGLVKNGLKNLLGKRLKTYTADEMEAMTPKIGSEALKLGRESLKLGMKKGGSVKAKDMCGGGKVKKMSSGGKVKSASSRADGCAIRGKTRA